MSEPKIFINFKKSNKMKLEKMNLVSLNAEELVSIDGGRRFPSIDWKKWQDRGEKLLTAIGLMDFADRFMEGWNSHKC